jgi:hypothetical protein
MYARYAINLAAFDIKPVFWVDNKITDHLSRYPLEANLNTENKVWLAVFTVPNNCFLIAQDADLFCKQVAKKLSSNKQNNPCKQYREMYRYENEILVFIQKEHGCEQVLIMSRKIKVVINRLQIGPTVIHPYLHHEQRGTKLQCTKHAESYWILTTY